jgi:hypothetical protein
VDQARDDAPAASVHVIHVELRLDGSVPTGVATRKDGVTRDFTGWMGLMAVVDVLTDGGEGPLNQEKGTVPHGTEQS